MKGFILRILFACAWLFLFYLLGYFIVDNYIPREGPVAYTFGIIYGLMVVASAFFITAASFTEPFKSKQRHANTHQHSPTA